jgi:hypothetical protein
MSSGRGLPRQFAAAAALHEAAARRRTLSPGSVAGRPGPARRIGTALHSFALPAGGPLHSGRALHSGRTGAVSRRAARRRGRGGIRRSTPEAAPSPTVYWTRNFGEILPRNTVVRNTPTLAPSYAFSLCIINNLLPPRLQCRIPARAQRRDPSKNQPADGRASGASVAVGAMQCSAVQCSAVHCSAVQCSGQSAK